MEINFINLLIILFLLIIFRKNNSYHKLNKIKDLNNFSPPNKILYINTLPKSYHVCNLTHDENGKAITVNYTKDINESDHCALYCAHKDCGSAMNYYNEHKDLIHQKCKNVHYLKGGAKDLLKDNRFKISDKKNCDNKINHKH